MSGVSKTDLAVIKVAQDGLMLKKTMPGVTAEDVQALIEPQLIIDDNLKEIEP